MRERLLGCNDHCQDLVELVHEVAETVGWKGSGLDEQLKPVNALICFLLDNAQLSNDIGRRSSPTRSTVVRTD